jgi:hypothetical protein
MQSCAALLALGLLLTTADATACSMGGVPEQDLPPLVLRSDYVFVARLTDYSRFVPLGAKQYMGRMEYVVLETIKGDPATRGVLFEWTGTPAVEGLPPGPACGPWVVASHNAGAAYLLFATRYPASGYLIPDGLSIRLDPPSVESERLLDFVRTLPQDDSTP